MIKNWTYRPGTFTEKDKAAIRGLTEMQLAAARVFVTGEVDLREIGEMPVRALLYTNDTVEEPLFVVTDEDTIRMTRFDASVVWPLLGVANLKRLIAAEADRFGVKPFDPEAWDFFIAMFEHLNLWETVIPGTGLDSVYLNALTVFHKPLYMDITASEFFSSAPSLVEGRRSLTRAEQAESARVYSPEVQRLTGEELDFLFNIK